MYFDELQVGMTGDIAVIEKKKMMAFARDYDNIPLHTDEEYAKNTPFGKLIAPGVMSFSRYGQGILRWIFLERNARRKIYQDRMVKTSLCR